MRDGNGLFGGRQSRGCALLIRRFIDVHGGAGAHEMLVTIDVINP